MSSPHDTNFFTALQLYKGLDPARTPKRIRIFTIDIEPNDVFSEEMSPPVQEASLKLAERIISEI
jgi:Ni,Fe-hydrogenase maturation factor